jgi:hypothetical protein
MTDSTAGEWLRGQASLGELAAQPANWACPAVPQSTPSVVPVSWLIADQPSSPMVTRAQRQTDRPHLRGVASRTVIPLARSSPATRAGTSGHQSPSMMESARLPGGC